MSGRHRVVVAALILLAVLSAVVLVGFAARACPVETDIQPCPDAPRNVAVVVALASATVALGVTPFAFLAEVVSRRRIVYRGAWWRASRRGAFAGLVIAALAGLRIGQALNVPVAIFVVTLAVAVEWLLARRDI